MKSLVPTLLAALACAAAPLAAQDVPVGPRLLPVAVTRDGIVVSLDSASIERTGDSTFYANVVYEFPRSAAQRLGFDRQMELEELDCAGTRVRGRGTVVTRRGMPLEAVPRDTTGNESWKPANQAEAPIVQAVCRHLLASFAASLPLTFEAPDADTPPNLVNGLEVARSIAETYPRRLRDEGIGGIALLRMQVGADGGIDPASLRVLWATRPEFGRAALRVARRVRFRPGLLGGRPVAVTATIPVTYMVLE
ncbi:MAG TPA: energy transducer TonB [Longimicrobium sp.]|jgi:TonB family protein